MVDAVRTVYGHSDKEDRLDRAPVVR